MLQTVLNELLIEVKNKTRTLMYTFMGSKSVFRTMICCGIPHSNYAKQLQPTVNRQCIA